MNLNSQKEKRRKEGFPIRQVFWEAEREDVTYAENMARQKNITYLAARIVLYLSGMA